MAPASTQEPRDVVAPMAATVVHVAVEAGQPVQAEGLLLALESMKMEHPVRSPGVGTVDAVLVGVGDTVVAGQSLVRLRPERAQEAAHSAAAGVAGVGADTVDLDVPRADLQGVLDRQALLVDAARPEAVAARRRKGRRTVRENIADLVDPGSFVEYRGLAIAAQRRRRTVEELVTATPADGLVAGTATINAELFGPERSTCVVLGYDATVLAGTQGYLNHHKKDRMLELAATRGLPVVLFAEGGGGRPGDTDVLGASWLDARAFHLFARLSGRVPTVAIVDGYCFAGNAALAGCADVIIATEGSNLGMAGPAMIEGGGLGRHAPETIGPIDVQRANGVVDVVVADDREAVAVARRCLGVLQGDLDAGTTGTTGTTGSAGSAGDVEVADQRRLRHAVPEDRRQVYDVRAVLEVLVDPGSLIELQRDAAPGMVTALARIGGRAVGVLANDPTHLGGAIDAAGADAAAGLLRRCDAHGLPVVVLCDTPGFMVGPDAEREGGVRRFSQLFLVGARLEVPLVAVVTRKAYGLGAQAMLGGHLDVPVVTLAWPTAELGPMGLEGAVRLGFRRELDAIDDLQQRAEQEREMIALAYEHARALNVASFGEIDDVIDPADTRARVLAALRATRAG